MFNKKSNEYYATLKRAKGYFTIQKGPLCFPTVNGKTWTLAQSGVIPILRSEFVVRNWQLRRKLPNTLVYLVAQNL